MLTQQQQQKQPTKKNVNSRMHFANFGGFMCFCINAVSTFAARLATKREKKRKTISFMSISRKNAATKELRYWVYDNLYLSQMHLLHEKYQPNSETGREREKQYGNSVIFDRS